MAEILDLKRINTFITIAETGSISKAAAILSYTPASVTIQLQQLEKELQVTLFDRVNKSIWLNNDGRLFYKYAKALINLNKEALDCFTVNERELTGSITLGTINSLCSGVLPNILNEFYNRHPLTSITVHSGSPQDLYNMLLENRLDLAIVLDEINPHKDLSCIIKRPFKVCCCAPKFHPLCKKKSISIQDLQHHPCILTEKNASYRQMLEQHLANYGIKLQPVFASDNIDLLIQLLYNNNFYSFLPEFIVNQEYCSQYLSIIPIKDLNISVNFQVIHAGNKYISREIKAFIDLINDYTREYKE